MRLVLLGVFLVMTTPLAGPARADDAAAPVPSLAVADVKVGMKGFGLTVIRGTEPERFEVEILGVIRAMQPGRDMILARCSGLGLEKTGVAAGMSGSPVYIDEKLVGAIAYTWEFGLEPIAGITPFSQMMDVAQGAGTPRSSVIARADGANVRMVPVATPITVSPMSESLRQALSEELALFNLVPVQGGGVGEDRQANPPTIRPGSALAIGMVTGDVQVSAIGTVTHVDRGHIWGFGHSYLGMGSCDVPLWSASIHLVLPLRSASLKLGSPMAAIGRMTSDTSTGIAGRLDGQARTIPLVLKAQGALRAEARTYRCELAWVPATFGSMLLTTWGSCLENEGEPPAELTVQLRGKVHFEGAEPLAFDQPYSSESVGGVTGLTSALSSVTMVAGKLASHPLAPKKITRVEAEIVVRKERSGASIAHAWAVPRDVLAGDELPVSVRFRLHGAVEGQATEPTRTYRLKLPLDLPPGEYRVEVEGAPAEWVQQQRRRPWLAQPSTTEQLLEATREQWQARSNELVLRIETKSASWTSKEREWNDLPAGVAQILASDPTSGARPVAGVVRTKESVPWPVEGSQSVPFRVVERRRTTPPILSTRGPIEAGP